jgi:hypothetical protein
MHAKGSLEEAVRLLSLAASLPVDRGLLEVLGRAAAAAMAWQDGAAALLPGPGGLPSRRGVVIDDVHELIREGKALPFRCVRRLLLALFCVCSRTGVRRYVCVSRQARVRWLRHDTRHLCGFAS